MTTPILGETVREMTANDLHLWLARHGADFGWRREASVRKAQSAAQEGAAALVSAHSAKGPGHITVLLPDSSPTSGKILQSQAGRSNCRARRLGEWWQEKQFDQISFWSNPRQYMQGSIANEGSLKARSQTVELLVRTMLPLASSYLERLIVSGQRRSRYIPDNLLVALMMAEDRRYLKHHGFDVRAIIRASVRLLFGRVEGASTIEQQLVRTLSGRRARTIGRKLSEILLATWCSSALGKRRSAELYLLVAYYGHGMHGLDEAVSRMDYSLNALSVEQASTLVSCLRYPVPRHPNAQNMKKLMRRSEYITRLTMKNLSFIRQNDLWQAHFRST